MGFRRAARLAAGATVALLLAACAPQPQSSPGSGPAPGPRETASPTRTPESPQPTQPTQPTQRKETTGLDAPWSVVFVGSTPLVSERDSGRILELAADGSARRVATLKGVTFGGEGGLLGLALLSGAAAGGSSGMLDPATGTVVPGSYLCAYSTAASGNRVQRFALHGAPGALTIGAAETVIDRLPSAANHNGGRIAFGPDGMLYVNVGDAAQPALAQDLDSLGGKILRLAPDGRIPRDNPFPGSPVYSYGHRNPQGIAWAEDGTMFASEFGQDTWDELNVITPGADYGWPTVEGIAGDARFTDPVQQWRPADASPSGIAVANGRIYIANLRGQRLRAVPLSDLGRSRSSLVGEYGRLRDVVLTPDGTLWILTSNTDGRAEPRRGDDRFVDTGLL